jgi:hypothetical protein
MPKKNFANLIWNKKDIEKFFKPGTIYTLVFTYEGSSSGPKKIEVAGFDNNWKLAASDKLQKKSGSSDVSLDNDFLGSVYILDATIIPRAIQAGGGDLYFTPMQYKDAGGIAMPFVTWEIKDEDKPLAVLSSMNPKPPAQ